MKLHPEVVPVRGYNRGIIYDLPRHNFTLVPNSLIDFIDGFSGKNIETKLKRNKSYKEVFCSYIDFLRENEYVFFTNSKYYKLFSALPMQWHYPGALRRVTVDYDGSYDVGVLCDAISYFESIGCKILNLRFFSKNVLEHLKRLFRVLDESGIAQISLYVDYNSDVRYEDLCLKDNCRVEMVCFFNAPKTFNSKMEGHCKVLWVKNMEEMVSKNAFRVDISMFSEAHYYNVFFNKYLYINTIGEIHPSEHLCSRRGDIFSFNSIKRAVDVMSDDYIVHSRKDLIFICRDCEFRYMCCSCRVPIQKGKYWQFTFRDTCDYNPYISKWVGDEGYQDVFSVGTWKRGGFVPDKYAIRKINDTLWGE